MAKIVVGVDLSPPSELALEHAIAVARIVGAGVIALMVDAMVELPGAAARGSREAARRHEEEQRQRYVAERRRLRKLLERWDGGGVELAPRCAEGLADEELPKVAAEVGAELIAVGSRGRTGFTRLLLGSVAEHVVRGAEQSVLVARGDAVAGGYRRVVIGTDFSPASGAAVRRALPLIAAGARVDLVYGSLDEMESSLDEALHTAAAEVGALRVARGHTGPTAAAVALGSPAEALLAHAATEGADLIVVGSHGRRGIRRLFLGSVAEATVRGAACTVLVAREPVSSASAAG